MSERSEASEPFREKEQSLTHPSLKMRRSGKFFERITVTGANFSQMQQALEDLMCEGYPGVAILGMLSRFILSDECTLTDISKAQVSIKISECDKCLVDGADELLQLLDVVALLFSCLKLKLKT